MLIKTIILDPAGTGFYISTCRWNDANYAFRTRHERPTLNDWRWIGSMGWFGTEENKAIFEYISTQVDLFNWYDGEFMEIDVTLDEQIFT